MTELNTVESFIAFIESTKGPATSLFKAWWKLANAQKNSNFLSWLVTWVFTLFLIGPPIGFLVYKISYILFVYILIPWFVYILIPWFTFWLS